MTFGHTKLGFMGITALLLNGMLARATYAVSLEVRSTLEQLVTQGVITLGCSLQGDEVGIYKDSIRLMPDQPNLVLVQWQADQAPHKHYDFAFAKTKSLYEQPITITAQWTGYEKVSRTKQLPLSFSCLVLHKNGKVSPQAQVVMVQPAEQSQVPAAQEQPETLEQNIRPWQRLEEAWQRKHHAQVRFFDALVDQFAWLITKLGNALACMGALGVLIALWQVGIHGNWYGNNLLVLTVLGGATLWYLLSISFGSWVLYCICAAWCLGGGLLLWIAGHKQTILAQRSAQVLLVAVLPLLAYALLCALGL